MLLCSQCNNMLKYMIYKGQLYLNCRICQTKERATPEQYLIKSTFFNTELPEQVNEHYIDDVRLPQKEEFCRECGEITRHKYIRNNRTLKISYLFCTKCRKIYKVMRAET